MFWFLEYGLERGGQWSARISVKHLASSRIKSKSMSLFFYAGMDENSLTFNLAPLMVGDKMTGIIGKTSSLGDFRMDFVASNKSQVKRTFYSFIDSPGPHKFTDSVRQSLRLFGEGHDNIGLDSDPNSTKNPNLIVYQVTAKIPFDIDIMFQ